jgi:hypothetical protein
MSPSTTYAPVSSVGSEATYSSKLGMVLATSTSSGWPAQEAADEASAAGRTQRTSAKAAAR